MNVTMLHLCISSVLHSPLHSPSLLSTAHSSRIEFHSLKLNNFFNTFFISVDKMQSLTQISRSTFRNFLEHPLAFASLDFYDLNVSEHQQAYGVLSSVVYVMDSNFQNCVSTKSHGGAIFFDQKVCSIVVARNSFLNCQTKKCGGALYGVVDNQILITQNIFFECVSIENGHAFTFFHKNVNGTTIVTECRIESCAPERKLMGMSAINDCLGSSQMRMLNMTNCHSALMSSCFSLLVHSFGMISFSNLHNCSGTHLVKTYEIEKNVTFAFLNIIGNVNREPMFSLENQNFFIRCIILKNTFDFFGKKTSSLNENFMSVTFLDCTVDFGNKQIMQEVFLFNEKDTLITKSVNTMDFKFDEKVTQGDIFRHLENIVPQKHAELYEQQLKVKHIIPTKRSNQGRISDDNKGRKNKLTHFNLHSSTPFPSMTPLPTETASKSQVFNLIPEDDVIIHDSLKTQIQSNESQEKVTKKRQTIVPLPTQSLIVPKKAVISKPLISRARKLETRKIKLSEKTLEIEPIISSTNTFTSSMSFKGSLTFQPTYMFTSSLKPSISMVPYVMYSSAAFVVIAVLASFCFISTPENDYNLIAGELTDTTTQSVQSSTMATDTNTTGNDVSETTTTTDVAAEL